ncbi:MAG: gamma-glutamylcyclotransferase [Desulfobacteraceae bacterium]|nr:MAG: gamma-glutamylcyclotransferase [Desulfobacteraceae bacterium]
MTQRLFVYGTLGPGCPNEHVLTAIGGTFEEATVKGHLKEQGWGAQMGYPGIVLDDAGDDVKGFIFCSDHLEGNWDKLDAFEGEEYRRVRIRVTTKDHKEVDAYIYMLREG